MEEQKQTNIMEQVCFALLFGLLFLSAGFSFSTHQRVENLNKKIQIRDSIILRMEQYQERRDSMMYEYVDKCFNRMLNVVENQNKK